MKSDESSIKENLIVKEKMHKQIITYQKKESHTNTGEAIRSLIRAGLKAEGYWDSEDDIE